MIRLPSVFMHHNRDYERLKRTESESARMAEAAAVHKVPLKEQSLQEQVRIFARFYAPFDILILLCRYNLGNLFTCRFSF